MIKIRTEVVIQVLGGRQKQRALCDSEDKEEAGRSEGVFPVKSEVCLVSLGRSRSGAIQTGEH